MGHTLQLHTWLVTDNHNCLVKLSKIATHPTALCVPPILPSHTDTHLHTHTHTHTHSHMCIYTCTSLHDVFSMPHPYDHIRLHLLGPPSELVLVAFNSTALQAGWLAPTGDPNDGSLLSYGAVCRSAEGSGVQYTLDIEEALGTLLTALSPYTHYHCCVWVVTSKAIGPSTCQFATTSQDSRFLFLIFTSSATDLFTMPPLLALLSSLQPSRKRLHSCTQLYGA